jgi:uncharacterized protein (TIGR03435 family)
MRLRTQVVVCAVAATCNVAAQEPAFDVASIRPNQTVGARSELQLNPAGRLNAINVTAKSVILRAYGLVSSQLIGAPAWVDEERYDLDARVSPVPPGGPDALLPHIRALLAERFKLKAHFETREMPAYALTFARRDQQLGSLITPTTTDCTQPLTMTIDEVRAAARDGWPPCGMSYFVSFVTAAGPGNTVKMRVRRSGATLETLATMLQTNVDRPVVDQTQLKGRFDVEYSFAPQPPTPGVESVFGPESPHLFVALEEQLGLKLESRRLSVPALVIDSIERPSGN